jgi:hypothetical protein
VAPLRQMSCACKGETMNWYSLPRATKRGDSPSGPSADSKHRGKPPKGETAGNTNPGSELSLPSALG